MRQHIGFAMRAGLALVLLLALTGMPANAGKGGNGGGHGGHGGGGGSEDTTPPGAVTNLSVGDVGIATVALVWIAPADDGYDATTGAPAKYMFRVRTSSEFTVDNWDDGEAQGVNQGLLPAYVATWPDPGETVYYTVYALAPETHYWIGVRAEDDAGNLSGITQVEADTAPVPPTAWATQDIDECSSVNRLAFDPSGNPAILYTKDCGPLAGYGHLFWVRSVGGVWQAPQEIVTGSDSLSYGYEDIAADPATGQWALAHIHSNGGLQFLTYDGTAWSGEFIEKSKAGTLSLAYCGGVPTIAYKRGAAIRVAQRAGNHWDTTEFGLPRSQNTQIISLDLACDDLGNPAVAFGQDRNGDASQEIVRVALWRSGGWQIETVAEAGPGGLVGVSSLAWDPSRADFTVAYDYDDGSMFEFDARKIGVCDRNDGVWSCADVDTTGGGIFPSALGLSIGSNGTASLLYVTDVSALWLTQRPKDSFWNGPELAQYVGYVSWSGVLASNPNTGELAVALGSGEIEGLIQYATPLPSP